MNIFESASRNKFRYNHRGVISTEELWNLSTDELEIIFKKLNFQFKQCEEESLSKVTTSEDEILSTKIKVIRHIYNAKIDMATARVNARADSERNQEVLEAIKSKKAEELSNKSLAELEAMAKKMNQ